MTKEGAIKRTKIVATLGPASSTPEKVEALIKAGANVMRLNLSHGTPDEHKETVKRVRTVAESLSRVVGVLMDLQGPRIRTGRVKDGRVEIETGSQITMTTDDIIGDSSTISTAYKKLPGDVKPGDRILIDDGLIKLEVKEIKGNKIECEVEHGGSLGERQGINLPGVRISAPSLSKKDIKDVEFARAESADFLALSFVRKAADITALRELLKDAQIPIIAKIENAEAIENLTEIIDAADGVMIARGDLGVELDLEDVPILQKRIIDMALKAGKPVITATQMLDSMIGNPRPTRAEASDVANAVFDGTDAVMLSGETATGRFPVKTLETMARILIKAESEALRKREYLKRSMAEQSSFAEAVTFAAMAAAGEVKAKAIVVFTESGATARLLSKLRPRAPVVAFSPIETTRRQLSLVWGVEPHGIELVSGDAGEMICKAETELIKLGIAAIKDPVVIVTGTKVGMRGTTNMMKIDWIGSDECKLHLDKDTT